VREGKKAIFAAKAHKCFRGSLDGALGKFTQQELALNAAIVAKLYL
jgi:hypothetical protein